MENLRAKITLPYQAHNGMAMDVYYPEEPRADNVCVLCLHDGVFADGSKDDEPQLKTIEALIRKGFIVISIEYTLYMQKYREKIKGMIKPWFYLRFSKYFRMSLMFAVVDCAMAIDCIYYCAEELEIDSSKIVLLGSSAGGIIALETDCQRTSVFQRIVPYNWKPLAVIAFAGAITDSSLYGDRSMPAPTLLVHGMKDKTVRFRYTLLSWIHNGLCGSDIVRERILKAGGKCRSIWFRDAGHEVSKFVPEMVDEITDFINDVIEEKRINEVEYRDCDPQMKLRRSKDKSIFGLVREKLQ